MSIDKSPWMAVLGICVMVVAAALPSAGVWTFISSNKINDPKIFIALAITALYSFITVSTIGIIILDAAGMLRLDASLMKWLGLATVGEVAGIVTIVVKYYFSTKRRSVS